MTAFAAALLGTEEGNDEPTLVVVTPPPVMARVPSLDYERGLTDAGAVLRDEVSMPDTVIAYLLDLARARERTR